MQSLKLRIRRNMPQTINSACMLRVKNLGQQLRCDKFWSFCNNLMVARVA